MSLCPIYFIFGGRIGDGLKFFWICRNFDCKPTNETFSTKFLCEFWDCRILPYLGVWPRKLNITKMSLPDVNSICLNGGQKYNAYLSHAFSRKNLPYWLMCRKTRIFAILENMGHFQNWISLQIGQYGSKWESQLVWSPRRGSRQNHDIIIWKYRF